MNRGAGPFPKEVWLHVCLHLASDDLPSLFQLAQVSKYVHSVAISNVLWLEIYKRRFLALVDRNLASNVGQWLEADQLLAVPCDICYKCCPANNLVVLASCGCVSHDNCIQEYDETLSDLLKCRRHGNIYQFERLEDSDHQILHNSVQTFFLDDPDDELESEKALFFNCVGCTSDVVTFAWILRDCGCAICEKCALKYAQEKEEENTTMSCDCGLEFNRPPLPDYRPRVVAGDILDQKIAQNGVNWRAEFQRVLDSGWNQIYESTKVVWSASSYEAFVGIAILYIWISFVLYANNWHSWLKSSALFATAMFIILHLATESILAEVIDRLKQGKIGAGLARRFLRRSNWMQSILLFGVLVSASTFLVALLWDVVLDAFHVLTWVYLISGVITFIGELYDWGDWIFYFAFGGLVGLPVLQVGYHAFAYLFL